jgi:hypothetical protein
MDRKSRPLMASIPISPTSIILTIVASTEKDHLVATIFSNEALNKPYMTLFLHESKFGSKIDTRYMQIHP